MAFQAINVLMSFAYLYVGKNLLTLLRDKPQTTLKFALAAIVFSLMTLNILAVLLNFYIWYQLRRMAKEASPEMESQVLQ